MSDIPNLRLELPNNEVAEVFFDKKLIIIKTVLPIQEAAHG